MPSSGIPERCLGSGAALLLIFARTAIDAGALLVLKRIDAGRTSVCVLSHIHPSACCTSARIDSAARDAEQACSSKAAAHYKQQ